MDSTMMRACEILIEAEGPNNTFITLRSGNMSLYVGVLSLYPLNRLVHACGMSPNIYRNYFKAQLRYLEASSAHARGRHVLVIPNQPLIARPPEITPPAAPPTHCAAPAIHRTRLPPAPQLTAVSPYAARPGLDRRLLPFIPRPQRPYPDPPLPVFPLSALQAFPRKPATGPADRKSVV